uniref:Uncharacterized protein n=1 Tax=viral metagenome TaxID=1070528 RepID=A0A6M3XVQ0_9ZZZZ
MDLLKKYWTVASVALLAVVVVAYGLAVKSDLPSFGSGGPAESDSYLIFSTSTLTSAYTGAGAVSSTIIESKGKPNFLFVGTYVPKSHGSQLQIQVERSYDMGKTFYPYKTLTPSASSTMVNVLSSPFLVDATTSGTAQSFSFDLTLLSEYIRISARESSTSTLGTITAGVTVASN